MIQPLTSISLILLTGAATAATVVAIRRLGVQTDGSATPDSPPRNQLAAVAAIAIGCFALFVLRWAVTAGNWHPLHAHVDGLLFAGSLFAGSILYIQTRPKLAGLSAFALPLLTVFLLWAVCSSLWTFRPFNGQSAATLIHTVLTYLGLTSCAIGAISGAMYLFVQRRLKHKSHLASPGKLASLETLERIIITAATLGFLLLTLSLLSGLYLVIRAEEPTALGAAWWASPKVWVATAAWAIYALLMNVRYASSFRGARAAWLAIAGLVLLFATYAIVGTIKPANTTHSKSDTSVTQFADAMPPSPTTLQGVR